MSAEQWKLNAADREVLELLIVEEKKEESATAFAKIFLPFGPEKWSKIKNVLDGKPSYFDVVTDPESVMAELRETLDDVPVKRANVERLNSDGIVDIAKFRAVNVAITECLNKKSPERLIKYLAPSGGGKTQLCTWLMRKPKVKARVVEAREAWKRSYYIFLSDVAKALGVRLKGENVPSRMEDLIIKFCSQQNIVLVIDEGEFFGASALNGIKLLLNKTRLVIVICAIAEAHDKWNRYFAMESDQIARRTHAIVELTSLDPKDAAMFFPANQFKDPDKATGYIATEASKFGHYSLIARTAQNLRGVERVGKDEVEKAVESARRQMKRDGEVAKEP